MDAIRIPLPYDERVLRERLCQGQAAGAVVFFATSDALQTGAAIHIQLHVQGRESDIGAEGTVAGPGRLGNATGYFLRLATVSLPRAPGETLPVEPPARAPEPSPVGLRPTTFVDRAGSPKDPEATRVAGNKVSPSSAPRDEWFGGLKPFDWFGNYQLLKRLGMGGMAEVFLARSQPSLGIDKLVALKVVLPEFGPDTANASFFLNEARISLTLQHPNVIPVFDFGEARGRTFLAMEYFEGASGQRLLGHCRSTGMPPPISFSVAVAIEISRALEYVHTKRDLDGRNLDLVHRDVSSGNVLLSDRGEVKLVDFGVAAQGAAAGGLVVGKFGYMPPEQARGECPNPSWDIYSLGVLLDSLLTLRPPRLTIQQLLAGRRPPMEPPSRVIADIPRELDEVVLSATEFDPNKRPPSAREMRVALEEVSRRLPPADIAGVVARMLGEELRKNKSENQTLIAEARSRSLAASHRTALLARPFTSVRRRIVTTRAWAWLTRRRIRFVGVAAAAGLLLAIGAAGTVHWLTVESRVSELLQEADAQVAAARLVGPGGHAALDLLLQAQQLRSGDTRVEARLNQVADALERLGNAAELRGDFAEAVVHFRGALRAVPAREALKSRADELEQRVRARTTAVVERRSP